MPRDKAAEQLSEYKESQKGKTETLTTASGCPVGDKLNSVTAGNRGPVLLQDVVYLEEMAHFDRERIPERVVHAKGAGAFGYFEVTDHTEITKYCKAKIFSETGKKTPLAVRFSTVGGESGSADTVRDPRGFAVKFYTEDGNWDLVGNNTPIFFIRDPLLFPSFIHTQKRNPVTHLKVAALPLLRNTLGFGSTLCFSGGLRLLPKILNKFKEDVDMFWDFITLRPETTHQVSFLFSDRGIPDGYRHMNGYGSHTFKLVNEKGEAVYCKFHYKTDQGIKCIPVETANDLAGSDPDYGIRDLYNAISRGDYPSYTFYIQVMTFEQAEKFQWNPFDLTKVWPHAEYPLIKVGKIVLNRNPKNYFAEVEQLAFSPAHLVPGVEPSPDKMLQGRLFAYTDTHRHRLGTNFLQIPVNCPYKARPRNYQRDGPQTVDENQDGAPNYYPNSFSGPVDDVTFKEHSFSCASSVCDRHNSANEDNFSQVGIFWRKVLKAEERDRLVKNIAGHLVNAKDFIQERAVNNFKQADPEYGRRVKEELDKIKKEESKMHGRL